jgi:dTDP-4-amino-4,6-dideoxygalactose transaminase
VIDLCTPDLGPDERRLLLEALDSTFVSSVGPFVGRFEAAFAASVGTPHAVACASGTAAIHLALIACGVGPGDTVLVSDFTFIASANPVVHLGARPVFIGSESRSWNLDPALVEEALAACRQAGRPAKAVIVVHILGSPADLAGVAAACDRHGAVLIEDAAEALGAVLADGRQAGTAGRIGCFSFNGNKLITTGGGGMCATSDAGLAARMRHLSTQARLPGRGFVHDAVGFNYRLTNLAAALGLAQLGRLNDLLARKHAIAARYRTELTPAGCVFQPVLPGALASDWLVSCLVPGDRDALLDHLAWANISSRPLWLPLSRQPAYAGAVVHAGTARIADHLADHGLSLPCSCHLTHDQQTQVIAAVRAGLGL